MIVDASAVIAILRNEPEVPANARAIAEAPSLRISAVTFEMIFLLEGRKRLARRRARGRNAG
jgi:uncharacterized protein with PIN domain